jgi:hypothetical protein
MVKRCCPRCGVLHPHLFRVADDVWQHYVLNLGQGDQLLCVECFSLIAQLTDDSTYLKEHGDLTMLTLDDIRLNMRKHAQQQW